MTIAPRVQVYTQLSCNAVYGHDVYDHTAANVTAIPTPHHSNLHHTPLSAFDSAAHSSQLLEVDFSPALHRSSPKQQPYPPPDDDGDEPDPRRPPSERCVKDAAVTAGAARLATTMTTIMGALSALTTGWWGSFGEIHGRTKVLAASTFGLLLTFVASPTRASLELTYCP